MRAVPFVALLALLAACGEREARALPDSEEFHRHVLAVVAGYPADGTHRYHWPRTGSWAGNARALRYRGQVVAEGDPQGRCHCCGLTFEVFLQAWQRWAAEHDRTDEIPGVADAEALRSLQERWFGSAEDPTCLRTAIVDGGLGRCLDRLEEAEPGDFVQFWRRDGSGHSAVFLGWQREADRLVGFRYWSTQSATNGIGERTEPVGDGARAIDLSRTWICRVGRP